MVYEVKVTRRGRTTIPKPLRERYSIDDGDKVVFADLGNRLVLLPVPRDPVRALENMRLDVKESVSEMKKEALETALRLVDEKLKE